MRQARAVTRRHLASSPFNTPAVVEPPEEFAVNDQVTHDKYGLGIVIGVEPDIAVIVDFRPPRVRIAAPYSKLTKL